MPARSIRAILVDDEPIARRVLREELRRFHDIQIIAEAADGRQAIHQIRSLRPDLVLLDLQMPEMDGFEVVRRLEGAGLPSIVMVTAYDQHAVRAFEAGAVDYLLKPVREERLARCLERVRQVRKSAQSVAESVARLQEIVPGPPASKLRKIVGRHGGEYVLLDIGQVLAFRAEHELVWIITREQRYLATQPLKTIERKLTGLNFVRIHRNCMVNLEHAAKLAPLSSQRWLLTLTDQQEFTVSKRQAHSVRSLLRW